jgi:AraC-like DNA-binding protein
MRRDVISDMLMAANARCVITGGLRGGGAWAFRGALDWPIKLEAVVRGSCWVLADDAPPLRLSAGDAVVLNGVRTVTVGSDPELVPTEAADVARTSDPFFTQVGDGDDDVIIGGHIDLEPTSAQLLTSALPAVLHAPAPTAEAGEMRRLLERIAEEARSGRPGAEFAADQHTELLLLQVLRTALGDDALAEPGWLGLLADGQLRPAVNLMHDDPRRAWRLDELADAAAMSRSHFAARFRAVSGQPPLTYLSHLRVTLAQRALRTSDTTIAELADDLGYASESSFSHAFTRVAGTSPSGYRRTSRR